MAFSISVFQKQAGDDKQGMQKTLDEVRKLFKKDRFATESGAVINEIGERYAKCSLKLSDSHRNALGAVMGGAIFTLADFAFAVAANWQDPGGGVPQFQYCLSGNCKRGKADGPGTMHKKRAHHELLQY